MFTPSILERADPYLSAEWHESAQSHPSVQPFITLSRESGSGGTSLARMLARNLNVETPPGVFWQVNEGSVTEKMLRANHLSPRIGRFLPEDHVSEFRTSVGEIVGLHPNLWELTRKTNETIESLARSGHTIIVGRGANFATAHLPGGLHVRLVAPSSHRARFLAQWYDLSEAEAAVYNTKRDNARRRYVKHNFDADVEDPAAYDLVINTARVSLFEAAKLIQDRVRTRL